MKLALLRIFAAFALLAPGALAATLEMTVTPSASSVAVGAEVQYSIVLTNTSAQSVANTLLSISFPSSISFTGQTNDVFAGPPGVTDIVSAGTNVTFNIGLLQTGAEKHVRVTLKPSAAGNFSISFRAQGQGTQLTDTEKTFVLAVNNGQTDLSLQVSTIPTAALAFDLISYNLFITNRGPSEAQNVILTNIIPANSVVVFNSAGTLATRVATNQLRWALGTMAASAGRTITVILQPVTNGNFVFNAGILATNISESAPGNNLVTNLLVVQPILTNNLVLTRGTPAFNRNTALIEETVTVSNTGSTGFPGGIRILVAGMTEPHRLFNVAGTNGLTPYAASTNVLFAGASLPVRMQYFFKDRMPHDLVLTAVQGPSVLTNQTQVALTSANIAFSGTNLTLNFPAATNRSYTIQVSDTVPFANVTSLRTITATTNFIEITDPISTNRTQRFYRAIETP